VELLRYYISMHLECHTPCSASPGRIKEASVYAAFRSSAFVFVLARSLCLFIFGAFCYRNGDEKGGTMVMSPQALDQTDFA
jgi:hypothetical protein